MRRPFGSAEGHLLPCDGSNGHGRRTERRRMGGIVPRRVHVDIHQGCYVRRTQERCDGRKRDPPMDLQLILATIIESVSWVTEDSLCDHEWITETKVTMKDNVILEAVHYVIEVSCPLQWALLRVFSTDNPQPQVREQRDKSGQIQGHSQQCNRVNM